MSEVELDRRNHTGPESVKQVDGSPLNIEMETDATDVFPGRAEFISAVNDQITKIDNDRAPWKERQVLFYKKRQGLRPPKRHPWPNCSNRSMMIEDKIIRKIKPAFHNLVFAPKLLADFDINPEMESTPEIEQASKMNEYVFDHVVRKRMKDFSTTINLLNDRFLQTGRSVAKTTFTWKTEVREIHLNLDQLHKDEKLVIVNTPSMGEIGGEQILASFFGTLIQRRGATLNPKNKDENAQLLKAIKDFQEGKKKFKFSIRETKTWAPHVQVLKAMDLIIWGGFNDIQEATMICHKMKWTPNDLRKAIESKHLERAVGELILEKHRGKSPSSNYNQASTENDHGYSDAVRRASGSNHFDHGGELIDIYEVCLYANPDKSGILRRCVLTYSPHYTKDWLKFKVMPYHDCLWPYVDFPNEETDEGWLAPRGVPHLANYFSTGIDEKHNQRNDLLTLNVPMIKYINGEVMLNHVQYRPGQGLPMKGNMAAAEIMTVPSFNTDNLMKEQQQLQFMLEDYLAIPDFTLTDPNAPGNQARRATEVLLKSEDRKSIFKLDLETYKGRLKRLYEMLWSRWLQYGPDEMTLTLKESDIEGPIRWNKAMGGIPMDIRPAGTFENTNAFQRVQQAEFLMGLSESQLFGPMIKSFNILEDVVNALNPQRKSRWMYNRKEWEDQMAQNQQGRDEATKEQFVAAIAQEKEKARIELDKDLTVKREEFRHESEMQRDKFKHEFEKLFAEFSIEDKRSKNRLETGGNGNGNGNGRNRQTSSK